MHDDTRTDSASAGGDARIEPTADPRTITSLARRISAASRFHSRFAEKLKVERNELERLTANSALNRPDALPDSLPDTGHSEHEVWWTRHGAVIKATLPDEFGRIWGPPNFALPSQYLVRLALANVVFGDECKLEAVVRRPGGLVVVMSHPERHGTAAVEAEVHDFMVKNHFVFYPHRFGPCWYRRVDNVLIFDAEPGNFVKTSLGLYPIDVILQNPDDAMLRLLLE